MTASVQPSDLNKRIVDLVRQSWEEQGIPLLLSRLGGQDDGEIARAAKRHSTSLRAYLSRELLDHIRVIQHSNKPPIVAAIPADAGVQNDEIDELLDRTSSHSTAAIPRFHPAFWTAFRKPLDESQRRYMSVRAPIHFLDTTPEEQPDGSIEIPRQFITGRDAESTEVHRQAQEWLLANEIDPTLLQWSSRSVLGHLPSNDLLGRLLLALDSEDLKRISMPLDIVNKLRRQKL